MTASEQRIEPRIRPTFRRLAIGVFVVLLPLSAWTVWDNVEARRMARVVDAILARREPVSVSPAWVAPDQRENAARYYDAAAALVNVAGLEDEQGLLRSLDFPGQGDTAAVLPGIRAWLDRNRDAETLLAKATHIERYQPVNEFYLRQNGLFQLARLADLRTVDRLAAGDADGAAEAAVQQLTIGRRLLGERSTPTLSMLISAIPIGRAAASLPAILALSPPAPRLAELQSALSAIDQDDIVERAVLGERAYVLGHYWDAGSRSFTRFTGGPPRSGARWSVGWAALRPYVIHLTILDVELMTTSLEQARRPWPARLDVEGGPEVVDPPSAGSRFPFTGAATRRAATSAQRTRNRTAGILLGVVRSALATLALEGDRRGHNGLLPGQLSDIVPSGLSAVPVDPFSGRGLIYKRLPQGYVVYSVGPDRVDNGGEGAGTQLRRRWGANLLRDLPPDIGITVKLGD